MLDYEIGALLSVLEDHEGLVEYAEHILAHPDSPEFLPFLEFLCACSNAPMSFLTDVQSVVSLCDITLFIHSPPLCTG